MLCVLPNQYPRGKNHKYNLPYFREPCDTQSTAEIAFMGYCNVL